MRKIIVGKLLWVCALLMVMVSCNASTPSKQNLTADTCLNKVDSCLNKVLGDSIAQIITSARYIKSYVWKNKEDKDTIVCYKRLHRCQRNLLRFIITDPEITKKNSIVYGRFVPCVGFVIKKSRTKKIYIDVDLGLGKWSVSDSKRKEIRRFDINSNNLLRFCASLYPTDVFIMSIYNNNNE